jgi:hypothetical protein
MKTIKKAQKGAKVGKTNVVKSAASKAPSKKANEDNYVKDRNSPMSTSSVKNRFSKSGNLIPSGVTTYRGVQLKGAPGKKKMMDGGDMNMSMAKKGASVKKAMGKCKNGC